MAEGCVDSVSPKTCGRTPGSHRHRVAWKFYPLVLLESKGVQTSCSISVEEREKYEERNETIEYFGFLIKLLLIIYKNTFIKITMQR